MTEKELAAGDTVDARCSKCKTVTNHTIIAMLGENPAQVQCNTCSGQHKFRAPALKKASGKAKATSTNVRKPRATKTDPQTQARIDWETASADFDAKKAVAYAMDKPLKVNALVDHKTFGMGIVKALVPPQKAEVLFKDGLKLLRCG